VALLSSFLEHQAMVKTDKSPVLLKFGAAVRRRRMDAGFSQEAFADHCGIDRSYMGGVERGERNLSLINIERILQGLDVQPSVFFKDLDPEPVVGKSSATGRRNPARRV
jgi:transcriptional regulator with XRE-family HTH domain